MISGTVDQFQIGSSLLEVADWDPVVVNWAILGVVARSQRSFELGIPEDRAR